MDEKSIVLSKNLTHMVRLTRTSWLIRTVFCRFPSYELAEHPCKVYLLSVKNNFKQCRLFPAHLNLSELKGVAQPYLSLWELSRELQQWDKSESFHDCRVDLVGDLP